MRSYGAVTGYDASNDLGRTFYQAVKAALRSGPGGLFGATQEMPTVLFFPADRRLMAPLSNNAIERPESWDYQPAQTFDSDGPDWTNSIDNLLVWLDWLNDGRLLLLLDFLNTELFKGEGKTLRPPRRDLLQAFISTQSGSEHPLSRLSHGERALLQLYVRTAVHMTRNTLILIDEIETHLHSTWLIDMMGALKTLLRGGAGGEQLQILFTTHNRELIRVFDPHFTEPGIVKGGYLIEDEIN